MAERKGLVIVHTGNGKGKTTAALGLAFRALGHGFKVLMVQFIKGSWKYGELESAGRFQNFILRPMGRGFVNTDGKAAEADRQAAAEALDYARAHQREFDLVILDEVIYAIGFGLISEEGRGSTFWFTLPIPDEAPAETDQLHRRHGTAQLRRHIHLGAHPRHRAGGGRRR